MADTSAQAAASGEVVEEDVLTFSTDDSEGAEPEPDTATTQRRGEVDAEEAEAGTTLHTT
jgi:hypothetical protein